MLFAYSVTIANEHFLSRLEANVPPSPRWVRSAYLGYYRDGNIYVNIQTLENELAVTPPRQLEEINGRNYADTQLISNLNISYCVYQRIIFIDPRSS